MKTCKLYLLRHGLTRGNLEGLYLGSGTDLPLCEEGRADLASLKAQFTYPQPSVVFTSPLIRATQTASVLFPGAEQVELQLLRESDFGIYDGKRMKDLLRDPDFARWMNPTSGFVPKGAEPPAQFHARCAKALMGMFEYMLRMELPEAACVTHGGVMMSMLAQKALPQRRPEDWMADPGCGYLLQCDAAMWMRDGLAEARAVLPFGYLGEDTPTD